MSSVLERAKALLARAIHAGTPQEEARSSAVIACKLIAEHGLLGSSSAANASVLQESLLMASRTINGLEARTRQLMDENRHIYEANKQLAEENARLLREARAERPRPQPVRRIVEPKVIASRYEGRCISCKSWYEVGARVVWRKGKGCMHESCAAA